MGVRAALAVCVTSFLLGNLSTHWIADWGTLWQPPLTDAHVRTSASYYHILASMDGSLKAIPVAISGLGSVALLWSFRDGRAGNLMFDGASLFLYACAIFVYLYSVIPSLTHLAVPIPSSTSGFTEVAKQSTLALASSHLVCSVALTGVLFLQAARYWVESPDGDGEEWGSEDVRPDIRPSRRHSAGEQQTRPARVRDVSNGSIKRRDDSLRRKSRK